MAFDILALSSNLQFQHLASPSNNASAKRKMKGVALIVLCKLFSLNSNVKTIHYCCCCCCYFAVVVVAVAVRPTAVAKSLSTSVTCVEGRRQAERKKCNDRHKKNSLSVRELMFSGFFSKLRRSSWWNKVRFLSLLSFSFTCLIYHSIFALTFFAFYENGMLRKN